MEIERKFLLRAIPGGKIVKCAEAEQGYFSLDPEVRFRSKVFVDPLTFAPTTPMEYFATIKSAAGKVRDEVEGKITEEFFRHVKEKIGKPFIRKTQYTISYRNYLIDASIVDKGSTGSFIYAECEFADEERMNEFVWPWPNILIKEVSDDPAYYMQSYWKRTRGV